MIRFSEHALKRAEERGIDLSQVGLVIREPLEVIDVKFGRKAAFKQFGEKYLVAIYEEQNDEIVVVTTLKVDKERLRRYGFSRV
jgi:predicted site-specific integrase-resolvase